MDAEGTHQVLLEQPDAVESVGFCGGNNMFALCGCRWRLYECSTWLFIREIVIDCAEVLKVCVSLCSRYLVVLLRMEAEMVIHLRVVEISTGVVLAGSVLSGTSVKQEVAMEMVGGPNEMQFVVLSTYSTQLWRMGRTLELMDLECPRTQGFAVRSVCQLTLE
jgi:hypothetical protein